MSKKSPSSDETLELHSSHIKTEMDEYDQKIRNQTLEQVEKIIENHYLKRGVINYNKLKEEIKNLKVTKADGSNPSEALVNEASYLNGRGLSKEVNGASPLKTGIVPTSRKGCGHPRSQHGSGKGKYRFMENPTQCYNQTIRHECLEFKEKGEA